LARANTAHANALLQAVSQDELSTRDLAQWFAKYQEATRAVRERMVEQPALFVKALHARDQELQDAQLSSGPEGQCLKDMRVITHVIDRLSERLPVLASQGLSLEVRKGVRRLRTRLIICHEDLEKYEHDHTADAGVGGDSSQTEQGPARDLEISGPVSQHSQAGSQKSE
jgi:hypothetical protein